jgi:hypothetical protein
VERIKALIDDHFSDNSNTVLRLTPAIPLLARPPEAK